MSDANAQQPVVTAATTLQHLNEFLAPLVLQAQRLTKWVNDNQEPIRRFAEGVVAFKVWCIDDIAAEDGSELRAILLDKEIPRTLIRHGWCPTADMSGGEVALLAEALDDPEEERAASARQVFIEKFRSDADRLEQTLVEQFPSRAHVISDAFDAHRDAKFNLSIPVFFAQADGIAWSQFDKPLFSSQTIRDADALATGIREGILRELFLCLMWEEWPLALSTRKRPAEFSHLNRHKVMHGEACDYGTEENSLKAISLLNFCAFVLRKSARM